MALTILVPSILLSQVKIKEKVEIKPKSPISSRVAESTADTAGVFYKPTLFVWEAISQKPVLTLPSILTISGTVSLGGPINAYQEAVVTYYPNQYQDIQIAWKGRASLASGGAMYEGQNPFTGAFAASSLWSPPDIRLLLFDYSGWGTGSGQLSWPAGQLSSDSLVYSFEGSLWQGGGTYVPVTASALVTGSFQQNVLFDHWYLDAYNTTIPCNSEMELVIMPFDGNWHLYNPYGLSRSDAGIVVKLEGAGDYAYLRSAGHEGHEITTTLADGCTLVFDASRGGFTGESHDVQVTVMGGGKSATLMFTLVCERLDHFQVIASPRMLAPGRSAMVKSIPMDINDQEIPPPGSYNVMFSLTSDDVFWPIWWGPPPLGGFAVDGGDVQPVSLTVPDSVARSGRVSYVVEGSILETFGLDSLKVTIHAVRDDDWSKEGTIEVKVKRTECVTVSVDPDTLAPGGTASVVLGSPGQYPTDQVYDVVLIGEGMLVSPTQSGMTLTATLGPVSYVAPATIESTMTVRVFALAYGVGGGVLEETQGSMMSVSKIIKRIPTAVVSQSLTKKAKEAQLAALAKLLADNTCTPAELTITAMKVPKTIVLKVEPKRVSSPGSATPTVTLKDKKNADINVGETDATVEFNLGNEAQDFGGLGSDSGPLSLTGVSYFDAKNGFVGASLGKRDYDGRFPLLISVSASADPAGKVYDEISLVGPHSTGIRYFQDTEPWGSATYDSQPEEDKFRDWGCAVTAMAMIGKAVGFDIDPGKLHEWMKENEKFNNAGGVIWDAVSKYDGGKKLNDPRTDGDGFTSTTISSAQPIDISKVSTRLSQGRFVIAEVKNPYHAKGKVTPHYVLITGSVGDTYSILDPSSYDQNSPIRERHTTLRAFDNKVYRLISYEPRP